MKILKKLLIVGLFSFLFIINAKAVTSNYSVEIKYNETFYNDINQDRINAIHDYIDNHNLINSNEQGNILIKCSNMNQNTWSIDLINSTSRINSIYKTGASDNTVWFYYNKKMKYDVTFNNNSITSFSGVSSGAGTLLLEFGNLNPLNENVILEISNTYFDTHYFNNNTWNWEFQPTNWNGYTNIPIKINNTIYEPNDNINVNEFIESLAPAQTSPEPIIYEPQIEYFNGYNKVTYYIDNYSPESVENGYFVRIVNNTDGTFENISPDVNNINQVIVKNYYENVNLSLQVHDREYNILSHYEINTDINYQNNANYSIRINDVSNEQRIVYYDYLIENNNNVKCYYSINGNNFIEDTNCTDKTYTYYLQLNENGNITWEIRDLQNNTLYNYSQNFVFNVGDPFINFKDNFNNDFLNLDVLINRYQNNDTIEYSINNSQFIQVNFLEDYSVSQNIKYFTINNVNNNDLIIVRVKRNNEIITISKYKANYLKYYNGSNENFNINNIFNKININNINEELKNYIKYFGNLILNSKIGNLLLLETFCLVITIIIKMIRN